MTVPTTWTARTAPITILCPRCGTVASDASSGACSGCGLGWRRDGNILVWDGPSVEPGAQGLPGDWLSRQRARVGNVLENAVHPLRAPWSPLVWLSQSRLEAYYRRTIEDQDLADAWRSRYLKGLNLPRQAVLLDHGCGRGRIVALAVNSGLTVAAQDIAAHPWWNQLPAASFQVVPAAYDRLPWKDSQFDVACDFGVLGHLPPLPLSRLFSEMFRVLHDGGFWIIQEANSHGYAARVTEKYYGRIYSIEQVSDLAKSTGFDIVDHWFEGFQAPLMPNAINYVRKVILARQLDLDDSGSRLAAALASRRRRQWVLRLQRKAK